MEQEGYQYPMNYFCESYKMFFKENLPRMQALALQMRRRQRGY
jgi:sulfatase maturation enzyme AslB (radical SAM superfamily)